MKPKRRLIGSFTCGVYRVPVYAIPVKEANDRRIWGECIINTSDPAILLAENLRGEHFQNVLLHEQLHMVAHLAGVNLSEQSVNTLALALRQAFSSFRPVRKGKKK